MQNSGQYEYVHNKKIGKYTFDAETNILRYLDSHDQPQESVFIFESIGLPENFIHNINTLESIKSNIKIVDSSIDSEIEDSKNNDAFFVLPSQLNGAEYPDFNVIVEQISQYKFDRTGGPRGQLAVHPAVGQFILDNAANEHNPWGINAVRELIEKSGSSMRLINGYLMVPKSSNDANKILESLDNLKIIGMKHIPVDGYYYDRNNKNGSNRQDHHVNLIYASAVPCGVYTNIYNSENLRKIANTIMIGEYYGALHQAYKHFNDNTGPVKIFLMPLGGGAFNNSFENIVNNIKLAVALLENKYPDVDQKLDIKILTFYRSNESKTIAGYLYS